MATRRAARLRTLGGEFEMRVSWFLPEWSLRLAVLTSVAYVGGIRSAPAQETDFRRTIETAKSKVFPSLIYVAPIVEEFSEGKRETREQGGSGVIISPDGFAVTNWHVVEKAIGIRVLLQDGSVTAAKKIGEDRETDVALLKLEKLRGGGETPFPMAALGDSDRVSEGQFVIAMGAPWGLSRSVSLGILSSTNRYLAGRSEYSLWLQTDASINPGNSGGPLVDTEGQVIGINTLGSSMGGDLGFAVPSNTVRRIVDALREHGEMRRSWTGIRLQPLNDFDRNMFFEGDRGVLVASVDAGSPAAASGIRSGDLLLAIGDQTLRGLHHESLPAINRTLAGLPTNTAVSMRVLREGSELAFTLTPRLKGQVEGRDFELKAWNFTVKTINEFATPGLYFFVKEGLFVQGVRQPGNAANAGLRRMDILVAVDGQKVLSIDDLRRIYEAAIADSRRDRKLRVEVLRNGLPYQLVLDYHARFKD